MEDMFILIRQDEHLDWYLLLLRDSYVCISCGPLSQVLEALKKIKTRYKNEEGLEEALRNTSYNLRPNPLSKANYMAIYKAQNGKYDHYIMETLEGHYQDVRDKKEKRKLLLKSRKTHGTSLMRDSTDEEEAVHGTTRGRNVLSVRKHQGTTPSEKLTPVKKSTKARLVKKKIRGIM